jgi:ferric-dicitrate binding protein FerR (iron transport regulator)
MSTVRTWCEGFGYRAATERAVDETSVDQARRRAARWYAWLKSPECTFQDRENFERWRQDPANAAAYRALLLAYGVDDEDVVHHEPRLALPFDTARLEADPP